MIPSNIQTAKASKNRSSSNKTGSIHACSIKRSIHPTNVTSSTTRIPFLFLIIIGISGATITNGIRCSNGSSQSHTLNGGGKSIINDIIRRSSISSISSSVSRSSRGDLNRINKDHNGGSGKFLHLLDDIQKLNENNDNDNSDTYYYTSKNDDRNNILYSLRGGHDGSGNGEAAAAIGAENNFNGGGYDPPHDAADYSDDEDQEQYYHQQQQQGGGGPPAASGRGMSNYNNQQMNRGPYHPPQQQQQQQQHPHPRQYQQQQRPQQQQQQQRQHMGNYQGYYNQQPYQEEPMMIEDEPHFPDYDLNDDVDIEPLFPDDSGPYQQQQQQRQRQYPPPPSRTGPQRSRGPPQFQPQQQQQQPPQTTTATTTTTSSPELELESFDKNLIFAGLKRMYRKKILPLELSSKYGHFHSPPLSPSDFEAKPMVLLLGQYSVGKTSFIRYLLGRDFPGIRIGPEPTTDRFNCILHGDVDKVIPGAALCSQADRPFRGLSPFGNNFLSKLEAVEMDAPILHNITLVDTPGILSGAKQSVGRNYDYDAVMKWFAERADLIVIMFDAHKLDISDELKRVIEMMKPHADKVRVVLNKADSISTQQLMRVYGALMWQLGKVMNTPEVCRVYIGSFWGAPLKNTEQATLLNQEKLDLFSDIAQLPQNAVMRRINELVKRARGVKVHAYIIHYLRKQLPYTFGKREKQAKLIRRLDQELVMCARRYELPKGDFPPTEPLRQALLEIKDLSEFPKLDKRMVKDMDKVFSVDIPELLERARGDN